MDEADTIQAALDLAAISVPVYVVGTAGHPTEQRVLDAIARAGGKAVDGPRGRGAYDAEADLTKVESALARAFADVTPSCNVAFDTVLPEDVSVKVGDIAVPRNELRVELSHVVLSGDACARRRESAPVTISWGVQCDPLQ